MRRWISDPNSTPPIYHDLVDGRKRIAIIRRINPKMEKDGRYRYDYQLIDRFVSGMGHAVGPVFPTLRAAKREAEKR